MRYIDAEALKQDLINRGLFPAIVKQAIDEAPTADVVEVVSCNDCKRKEIDAFGRTVCVRNGQMIEIKDNDFCSYGQRRE